MLSPPFICSKSTCALCTPLSLLGFQVAPDCSKPIHPLRGPLRKFEWRPPGAPPTPGARRRWGPGDLVVDAGREQPQLSPP